MALTWPLAARLRVAQVADPAFFTWEIGWTRHALFTDPARLPHANIFHPVRYALGFDEPILGTTLLVLPLALATDDAVLLFNVARLLTFVATAFTTWLLARSLGCPPAAAVLAALGFTFSPIRVDQMGHLSTLGTQWLPLVLLFAVRYARDGRRRDAAAAGVAFAAASYACGYHGVVGLAILPVFALVLVAPRLRERWTGLVLAGGLAGLLLLPLWALHQAAFAPYGFERGHEETVHHAASLETFLAASSWNHVYGRLTAPFRGFDTHNLFPGLVLPVLVAVTALRARRQGRRPPHEAVALGVLAVLALVVAVGPEVRVAGRVLGPGPYALVRELPPFSLVRAMTRAGVFLALPLAVLAGLAATALRLRPRAVALLAAAFLAEAAIVPLPMPVHDDVVFSDRPPPPVYAWLATQPGDDAVLELPMLVDLDRPTLHESTYMVRSTRHWKRLANGYAGTEPPPYLAFRERMRRFPSPDAIEAIRGAGIRWVVLHRGGYGPNKRERLDREMPAYAHALTEVARFGDDVVYELKAPTR